ncbi:archaetidylserine decarboxylase [Methanobacterium aggregans]|uniref:archaetidylserine decarboxylase n=1 Tax=Methanobacterium aggregans TaxID=1615586 RepID=UPI001AE7DCBE|nr:archaetidylserine decarboxylase [Methanobacterium aggregans]MBP2045767.1 phosphatidylserine decarboxylase [Methanobacterium aggregans]
MFVKGTYKKVGILLTIAVLPFLFGYVIVTFILFSAIAFLMQFFRDPKRKIPSDEGVVVAPADGRILTGRIDKVEVVGCDYPLMEHLLDEGERGIRISTFMSPFDVHVQRAPISGEVVKTKYCPGKFKMAWKNVEKENEKNLIVIDSDYGKVGVIQIAGFIARRIVQYVQVGDKLEIGDKLGMIRFGSRVDLIVPHEKFEVRVAEGQKPKAGETIMAELVEKVMMELNEKPEKITPEMN